MLPNTTACDEGAFGCATCELMITRRAGRLLAASMDPPECDIGRAVSIAQGRSIVWVDHLACYDDQNAPGCSVIGGKPPRMQNTTLRAIIALCNRAHQYRIEDFP